MIGDECSVLTQNELVHIEDGSFVLQARYGVDGFEEDRDATAGEAARLFDLAREGVRFS